MTKNLTRILSAVSLSVFVFLTLAPAPILANAGIPIIVFTLPAMIFALLPIVFIETEIIHRVLQISYIRSLAVTTLANIVTTVIGYPLAWIFLFIIQLAGLTIIDSGCGPGFETLPESLITLMVEAAWVCPSTAESLFMIITVIINFLLAFYISFWFEFWITRLFVKNVTRKKVRSGVLAANIVSYVTLIIIALIFFIGLFLFNYFVDSTYY